MCVADCWMRFGAGIGSSYFLSGDRVKAAATYSQAIQLEREQIFALRFRGFVRELNRMQMPS